MTVKPTLPKPVVPAGSYIEEWLEDADLTQTTGAAKIGIARKTLNQIIRGHAPITGDTAVKLERASGISAEYWLRVEANYQAGLARRRAADELVACKPRLAGFPVARLRALGHLTKTWHRPAELGEEILRFAGAGTIDSLLDQISGSWCAAAYRQSEAVAADDAAVFVWLRLGELEASNVDLDGRPFDRSRLRASLATLRSMTANLTPDLGARLVALFRDAGVRLVFVPAMPKAATNGATRSWAGAPLVQMSDRGKRDDMFWFTLFHEVYHVLNDDLGDLHLNMQGSTDESENQANRWAAETLVPAAQLQRLGAQPSLMGVRELANDLGIAPGIIVGQLRHRGTWGHHIGADLIRKIEIVQTDDE